jgi:hypothetical protein
MYDTEYEASLLLPQAIWTLPAQEPGRGETCSDDNTAQRVQPAQSPVRAGHWLRRDGAGQQGWRGRARG